MATVDKLTFSQDLVGGFCVLSGDRNPLHVDAVYASRTPFGQPVVYGVLGLLGALRCVLQTMQIRLTNLRATFQRPLYAGVEYTVDVKNSGAGEFTIQLLRGTASKLHLHVAYESAQPNILHRHETS